MGTAIVLIVMGAFLAALVIASSATPDGDGGTIHSDEPEGERNMRWAGHLAESMAKRHRDRRDR